MCTDLYKPHLEQFGSAGAPAPEDATSNAEHSALQKPQ